MNAEEILIKLGIDATAIEHGLRAAGEKVKEWAKDITKDVVAPIAALFAADKLKEKIKETAEWGAGIKLAAKEAGTGVEFIQGLTAASHQLGISADVAAANMAILARKVGEARVQGGEAAKVFSRWGVDLDGKSQEEVFYDIADAMMRMRDPAEREAMAFDLMGKNAKEMAAALPIGAEAMKKLVDESAKLSSAEIEKLDELDARVHEMARRWKMLWGGIVASFIDVPKGNLSEHDIDVKMRELMPDAEWDKPMGNLSQYSSAKLRQRAIDALTEERRKKAEAEANSSHSAGVTEEDKNLLAKAGEIRAQTALKELDTASRYNALIKKRDELEKDRDEREFFGLSNAKDQLELAKVEEELLKTKVELLKEAAEQDKKAHENLKKLVDDQKREDDRRKRVQEDLDYAQRRRAEDIRGPSYSTIKELADNPIWHLSLVGVRGMVQDNYSRAAKRIEFLEARSKREARFGNRSGADADLAEAQNLRGYLEKEGVIKEEHHLESIDEQIKKLREDINTKLDT
ncbi:MAG: Tail tape measure protein core region [Pedosphaera sp.]|nr:Tail tape measure protein core region [Pedosphaera sp.]